MALLSVYSSAYIECLFLPFLCTLLLCGSLHCRSTLIPFARFAGFTAVIPLCVCFFFFLYIHIASPSFISLDSHTSLPDLLLILSVSPCVTLLYIFPSLPSFICFIHLFPTCLLHYGGIGDGSFGSVAVARVRTAGSNIARRGTMVRGNLGTVSCGSCVLTLGTNRSQSRR